MDKLTQLPLDMRCLSHIRPTRFCLLLIWTTCTLALNAQQSDTVFTNLEVDQYPVSEAGLPQFACQYEVDARTWPAMADSVRIIYPVFKALSAEETAVIKACGYHVAHDIRPVVTYGVSRGQGLADIVFCPIVKRKDKFYRLVSCKIFMPNCAYRSVSSSSSLKRLGLKATAMSDERWAAHSVLSSGHWVKIRVTDEGVYELTENQLHQMGFADISRVKVFGYGGRPLPEDWTFNTANAVPDDLCEIPLYQKSSSLLFFAEGLVRWQWNASISQWTHEANPYSRYSYYFVTEGDAPKRMSTLAAAAAGDVVSTVNHHALFERDQAALYEGGRELYDPTDLSLSLQQISLAAPDIVEGSTARVYISVGGVGQKAAVPIQLTLAGETLGSFNLSSTVSNESGAETRRTFTTDKAAAKNTFNLSAQTVTETRLNALRLTYERRLNAASGAFAFSPQQSGPLTLSIQGATSSTQVWRLQDALHEAAILPATNEGGYQASCPDGTLRYAIVDVNRKYPSPQVVGSVANQDLHATTQADMVIVVPPSGIYAEQAERLAQAHRQHQGLNVVVVNAGQIYNEYSSGAPDATAIRRYLKMLYDRAESQDAMPRYLLLFGACAWDNRMLSDGWSGMRVENYLPAFEVSHGAREVSNTNIAIGPISSYVTDDYYTWLDDSEGTAYTRNKPDVAVGRIPCTDERTAAVVVDKLIAYMQNKQAGAWQSRIFVLGDDLNNALHMRAAERVATALSTATNDRLRLRKVYWDVYPRTYTATGYAYPQATALLQTQMQQGALLFNYIGHGSPEQISHSRVLVCDDFTKSSSGHFPLWVMASCEISPYDTPGDDIGRLALANPTGGAIGVVCASRSVYADYNEQLNTALCKQLFPTSNGTAQNSIGEALRLAKNAVVNDGTDVSINKLKYILLGDPALLLAAPSRQMFIDSINGQPLRTGQVVPLAAGSVVTLGGYVSGGSGLADPAFQGTVTLSLADRMETITCLNNSGGDNVMTFKDRTTTLFETTDSVRNGRFTVLARIPRDISYSDDRALISLYALSADTINTAAGKCEQICLNGSVASEEPDTLAPKVMLYLDNPDFPSGGITGPSPLFVAEVSDDNGIAMASLSAGRGMELVLDGDTGNPMDMGNYFAYDFGSYMSGRVTYPLSNLSPGEHSLRFRVSDTDGNVTTETLAFHVSETLPADFSVCVTENPAHTSTSLVAIGVAGTADSPSTLTFEVYDLYGHCIWQHSRTVTTSHHVVNWPLTTTAGGVAPSGIYLYRAVCDGPAGRQTTETQKIIVVRH